LPRQKKIKEVIEIDPTNPNKNSVSIQDKYYPTLINSTYLPEKPGGKNLSHNLFDNTKFDHEIKDPSHNNREKEVDHKKFDEDLQLSIMANKYRNLEKQY